MTALLETRELRTCFPARQGVLGRSVGAIRAVDGVDLEVAPGEWLGLVGESGCGKTTLAKALLRLIKPTSGSIYFDLPADVRADIDSLRSSGEDPRRLRELRRRYDLAVMPDRRLRNARRKMQLVHQDPYTSLDPRMKIGDIIAEPIRVHGLMTGRRLRDRTAEILQMVGLSPNHASRYPHQFSGGQRQRIAIARALAAGPAFVIFDEPTSALDVSVQAQVLTLLKHLKQDLALTYLYITHDLVVAESVCSSVAVMYLGKIVETGHPADIFHSPKHPYSAALVAATPVPDPALKRDRVSLSGEAPSPASVPSGCRFHPRCPHSSSRCREREPRLEPSGEGRRVACWHPLDERTGDDRQTRY